MLSVSVAYAQKTISGTVTDGSSGEVLVGVNVIVKGTATGTLTDLDGNYRIEVADGSALLFTYVGYATAEIAIGAASTVDVSMTVDVTNLEEVVVTGLASSIKRSNLANAVATVSGEELVGTTNQPTLDGALYGKMTGVNITASSGAPGGGIGVRLRGISSIKGNNQPLFIIDGVYLNNSEIPSGVRNASGANRGNEENSANRIADLDPSDIESIEVLKGASAAAIYGTRANAGVVIITTKTGKSGRTDVNFSQDIGFSKVQRLIGLRNWTAASVAATYDDDEAALFSAADQLYDYEEEIYGETGLITNTKISVSGGNEKSSFYLAGSTRDEEGIIKGTGFDRNSIRLNLKHKLSDKLDIAFNTNYINTKTNRGFTGNENEGGLSYGYNLAYTRPWYDLHPDEFGNYPDNPTSFGNMLLVRDKAENSDEVNRFITGAKINYNIIKETNTLLKLTFNGGIDYFLNETYVYVPETHQGQVGQQNGFVGVGKNTFNNRNFQSFVVFDKYLNGGALRFSTQAGISYLKFDRNFVYNQATQLIPGQTSLEQSGARSIEQTRENDEEFGIIFQEEVNWDDKVIGTIGMRMDKSSLNGDPNKYYNFLKASLAVNIANFDFWTFEPISQFKLRTAYGQTGSSATYGSLFTNLNATNIQGNGGTTIDPKRGTPTLFPETSSEIEFGADLGFLDGKVGLEATYYIRKVEDLLFDRSTPTSSGFTSEVLNEADLENKGIELGLSARPISNDAIQWTTNINWWKNQSTLTRLGVDPFPAPDNGFGLGLGTFYLREGHRITAIVQNDANGVATDVANTEPDFQMSFMNQLTFLKNFDFSFLLHWKKGGDALNLSALLLDDGGINPEIDGRGSQYKDTYIESAAYVRLREVALYYRVPMSALGSVNKVIRGIKVGISGRNLWTQTDYSGYDPEVSTNGSGVISNGLDVTPFPSTKQFYFHLNVNF
ncbi:TonB-linked outer membrane protein, SusC/RagA family [Reichenbachiella faecimaris]|uniref:TonB-linked outer membrane protein, SusC/RagA family n=2 Tax=Reichenbachiella faecimaris TaxID=692418 RepID=A0A1W2GER5_REIFA|nr:TonB-linked outer membrane protein, SusC/RagA family [Reichenbachiella faecimaris]